MVFSFTFLPFPLQLFSYKIVESIIDRWYMKLIANKIPDNIVKKIVFQASLGDLSRERQRGVLSAKISVNSGKFFKR